MMSNIDFYNTFGIDLIEEGIYSYAFNKFNALKLLKILKDNNMLIICIDILYKYDTGYSYLSEPDKYVSWNLDTIDKELRYDYLKNKIEKYDAVKDIENIAFIFVDDLTYNTSKIIHERKTILNNLLEFNKSINEIALEIKSLSWDWANKELCIIKKSNIINVLERFNKDELTSSEIEQWANLIECREDLDVEDKYLYEVIYKLANPSLEGSLSKEFSKSLIVELKN